ncbi:hypothetical protein MTR_8g015350 [Medicago truncatula]|uniref:Uncharacterized protein n=1 Tax=Medicago truncatula TaxID=3880 RepID=A0A072TN39_MEDTR|nr:hypothetical protein MTR_8g015350 [Medicago truncatula]
MSYVCYFVFLGVGSHITGGDSEKENGGIVKGYHIIQVVLYRPGKVLLLQVYRSIKLGIGDWLCGYGGVALISSPNDLQSSKIVKEHQMLMPFPLGIRLA